MSTRMSVGFGVAIAISSSVLIMSSGVARADVPDVVGKTYGEAKSLISQNGGTPVVATVVGDRVPQDQCYVTSTSKVTSRDSSGRASYVPIVQVNLSCYSKPASGRAPGFSAGNFAPDAAAVREADIEAGKKWKQSPDGLAWCAATQTEHPEWGPIADCPPVPAANPGT